jgi:hypothetical protein
MGMNTTAGDRLAGLLDGAAAPGASSVQLRSDPRHLRLEVEGVGHVPLPVSPAQARQLCQLGRRAPFGRGTETLTDPNVRDTWEIPRGLVRIEWGDTFESILGEIRDGLGLPAGCELAADLHSMLVYEAGQFFVAHQDSEKDDQMVATLVVALPATHTGGALVVEQPGGETTSYRGSKVALTLVAFYADRRHEVRPVKSGHRITLTYNLLLRGDTSRPVATGKETVKELARCLDEHFATRVTRRYRGADAEPPSRLVYLLDHEYTARGLSWSRLKGSDAHRASLLRAAAERAGCEPVLALADVQETWSAYEPEPRYRYGYGYLDGDEDGPGDADPDAYELEDLVNSSVRLLCWTGPAGAGPEEVSLSIDDAEVCATTRSVDLQPYASEYEGYMGNYGNIMDRWYRRAALVMWPHQLAFRNRAEASPAWALDELATRVRTDLPGARAAAATLAPLWDTTTVRAGDQAGLFGKALRLARALDDVELARMLLYPFRIETLGPAHVPPLAQLAGHYGVEWLDGPLRTWFGHRGQWHAEGPDRLEWLTSLPRLCEALRGKEGAGAAMARRLLELSAEWLDEEIRQGVATWPPSFRDRRLGELGPPLAALLAATNAVGAAALRDKLVESVRTQDDPVLACLMPALLAAGKLPAGSRGGGFDDLAAECAARLRARLDHPPRPEDDWSIELPPGGCACELCGTLRGFAADRAERTLEWPLAKQRRQHIHSRVDMAELPIRHETRRTGRPYTLVLTKSRDLFALERRAREQDEADLRWLTADWTGARSPGPPGRGR